MARAAPTRPEVRRTDGTFRLLSGADTSALAFQYPRNFVAPDGRIFGYDSNGVMYYVNTAGTGSILRPGPVPVANRGASNGSAAMFRPGRILNFGGNSNQAIVIDIRNGAPMLTPTSAMATQRHLVNATILPNGRVVATGGSRVYNELHGCRLPRRYLGPRHRRLVPHRERRGRQGTALPLDRDPVARRHRAGRRRRCAGTANEHERRDLLSAVPLRHQRRAGQPADDRAGPAGDDRDRRDVPDRLHRCGVDRARHDDQDRLGHAFVEHGAAVRRASVHDVWQPALGPGADPRRRCAARLLPVVRARCGRHAVEGAHRQDQHRDQPEPRDHTGAAEPWRQVGDHRHRHVADAERDRSER